MSLGSGTSHRMLSTPNPMVHQLSYAPASYHAVCGEITVGFKGLDGITIAQLVPLVYKVTDVFNKDNAAKIKSYNC
uniref:Uncharacterized protein n=1 Tax=Tanacetum cinerariifolium TaxID=118510 RepID=A0A6L2L6Z5_TANCI|nr:hypothetical protein [Tanacetum cinerariifolium]